MVTADKRKGKILVEYVLLYIIWIEKWKCLTKNKQSDEKVFKWIDLQTNQIELV